MRKAVAVHRRAVARRQRSIGRWFATMAPFSGGLLAAWDTGAAPISFNTALPVAKGEFVARAQVVLDQSGEDPSGTARDRTSWAVLTTLGYGATGRLALFGALPYLDKELTTSEAEQRVTRSASGIGDVTLFGRYTACQWDRPGQTLRIAPFAGIKAPTGESDARDALGSLPPRVQVGSGSWDPLAGVVMTYQTLAFQIDSQLGYRLNTEANGFEAGDEGRWDSSLQFRFWPRTLGSGIPTFIYGNLEANVVYQDNDRVVGREDPDSGGGRLFLTPGIQYVSRRWILEAAVQIPMVQALNGTGLEEEYIVRGGFRFNF